MKKTILLHFACILLVIVGGFSHAGAQVCLWARQSNGNHSSWPLCSAVDAAGNTWVAGSFDGPQIAFGGITLYNTAGTATYIFLAKFDPSGNVLSVSRFGGGTQDFAYSVCTDANGYVYLYGTFYSPTITFGPYTLTNTSIAENFLVKLDGSSNVIWAKAERESPTSPGTNKAVGVAYDNMGGIVVTGYYDSSITIGTNYVANPNGTGGVYLARYDTTGPVTWAKTTGDTSYSYTTALATDGSGNIFISGSYTGRSISFDAITLTNTLGDDLFLAKYNSAGSAQWARTIGDSCSSIINALGTDAGGDLYATGYFGCNTITFGSTVLTNASTSGNYNIFLTQYNGAGSVMWAKSVGGTNSDEAYALGVGADGNPVIGGISYSPSVSFGSIPLPHSGLFLAKYNGAGSPMWVKGANSSNYDIVLSLAIDGSGIIHATGNFDSTFHEDTCTLTDTSTTSHNEIYTAVFSTATTGINLASEANGILLFPNPANSLLTIQSTGLPVREVVITNLLGQVAITNSYANGGGTVQINIATLPAGVYIARINGAEVRKFVKE